jgi:hypothetical protein
MISFLWFSLFLSFSLLPFSFPPPRQALKDAHDVASAKHNAAVKEIDVKNGHEFGENMRVYNEERQRISIKNNEIELARLAHVAQRNKERQASKLKSLASVEYLKVQQDMVLLCHALPCEVYLTRPQKITLNQQIVNMDQDLQRERMVRERWDTLAIKEINMSVVHGCSWLGTHTKPLLFLLSSLFFLLATGATQEGTTLPTFSGVGGRGRRRRRRNDDGNERGGTGPGTSALLPQTSRPTRRPTSGDGDCQSERLRRGQRDRDESSDG